MSQAAVRNKSRATKNKQSKIPVLKTERRRLNQTSLELERKESEANHDVFNLEELLCDIQDSIEKKHPGNFLEEMKEIIGKWNNNHSNKCEYTRVFIELAFCLDCRDQPKRIPCID